MELDDLKQSWQQTPIKKTNIDIMQMIQNKSYGPVSELKRSFRRQIIAMTFIPIALVLTSSANIDKVFTSILFWAYVVFCLGIIFIALLNLRVVRKIEDADNAVRVNLEQWIASLETRVQWNITWARASLIFLILLAEVVPYIQHYSMLDHWHSFSPFIRFGAYATIVLLQHFMIRIVGNRKFGRHITYLKEVVKEMQ
jgi:uncharacterized membrane protein YjfL (UPF0719 family)